MKILKFLKNIHNKTIRQSGIEDSFYTLMEFSSELIVFLDKSDCIHFISDRMLKLAGITRSDWESRSSSEFLDFLNIFSDLSIRRFFTDILSARKYSKSMQEIRELKIQGEKKPYYYDVRTGIWAGGYFICMTDIRIETLALQEADAAKKAKNGFLANLTHEIRTPVNAIIGMSDLIREDNLDPMQRAYFSDIRQVSHTLINVINNALDFAQMETGHFQLAPSHYNVHVMFDNLCSISYFLTENKGLTLKKDIDPAIPQVLYGDEVRVRQILANLLNNAVRHTSKGSVRFSLNLVEKLGARYLCAEIEDTGIGIKEEDFSLLFSRFDNEDTHKDISAVETGLGLMLTNNLVELMGGSIEAESVYGRGSKFTVYIPLVLGDPDKAMADTTELSHVVIADNSVQALIVDDIPLNLTVAAGFLSKYNINADTADNGEEAVRMVEEKAKAGEKYDIVFMDYIMPTIDGAEATRIIRAGEAARDDASHTIIVALTANVMPSAKEALLSSGMDDFMSKPITAGMLNTILLKWLPKEKVSVREEKGDDSMSFTPDDPLFAALSAIKGLNVEKGLLFSGGGIDQYRKVLKQFVANFDASVHELREAARTRNWKNYAIHAHAFKGVFAMLGMPSLSEQAKTLEFAAKEVESVFTSVDACQKCNEGTEPFIAAMTAFKESLPPLGNDAPRTESIDDTALRIKLANLREACVVGKARVAAAIADEFKTFSLGTPTDAVLAEIAAFVVSFDYEKALEKIDALEL